MTWKDWLDILTGVGTLTLSLCALVFSIYTYRQVSLKNDFKRKQLDVVYQLIETLQDTIIHFERYDIENGNRTDTSSGCMFRFFRMRKEQYKEFIATDALLVDRDVDYTYKFIEFSEHPYLPTSIAVEIRKMVGYATDRPPVKWRKLKSFTYLGTGGFMILDDPKCKLYTVRDNPIYFSLGTFCDQCTILDKEIHKWLKSVGITEFNKKEIIE